MLLAAFDSAIRERVRELNIERRNATSEVLAARCGEIRHHDVNQAIHHVYHMYLSTMQGRLVFFTPSISVGVGHEFIFGQLKLAVSSFLRGVQVPTTGSAASIATTTDIPPPTWRTG